jgi:hypothetical protein
MRLDKGVVIKRVRGHETYRVVRLCQSVFTPFPTECVYMVNTKNGSKCNTPLKEVLGGNWMVVQPMTITRKVKKHKFFIK